MHTRLCLACLGVMLAFSAEVRAESPRGSKSFQDVVVTNGQGLAAGAKPRVLWEFPHEGGLKEEACHMIVAGDAVLFSLSSKLRALDVADGKERWVAGGYGTPLVEDGVVYVAEALKDSARFKALRLADGSSIWERQADGVIENGWRQIRTAKPVAAIRGERVYFAGFDTSLHCFDKATGRELWKNKAHAEFFPAVPIPTEDAVILLTLDSANPQNPTAHRFARKTNDASVYAFDAETGKVRWRVKVSDLGGHRAAAVPACRDGVVYVADHGTDRIPPKFWALDAKDGRLLWETTLTAPIVFTTVLVHRDKAYLSGLGSKIDVVDLKQHRLVGQLDVSGVEEVLHKVIVKPENVMYVATWGAKTPQGGKLFGFDLNTGRPTFEWIYPDNGLGKRRPVITGTIGVHEGKVIHNTLHSNKIVCITAEK